MKQLSELKQEIIELVLGKELPFYYDSGSFFLISGLTMKLEIAGFADGASPIIYSGIFDSALEMMNVEKIYKDNFLLHAKVYQPVLITEILDTIDAEELLNIYNNLFQTNYMFAHNDILVEDDLTGQDENE